MPLLKTYSSYTFILGLAIHRSKQYILKIKWLLKWSIHGPSISMFEKSHNNRYYIYADIIDPVFPAWAHVLTMSSSWLAVISLTWIQNIMTRLFNYNGRRNSGLSPGLWDKNILKLENTEQIEFDTYKMFHYIPIYTHIYIIDVDDLQPYRCYT